MCLPYLPHRVHRGSVCAAHIRHWYSVFPCNCVHIIYTSVFECTYLGTSKHRHPDVCKNDDLDLCVTANGAPQAKHFFKTSPLRSCLVQIISCSSTSAATSWNFCILSWLSWMSSPCFPSWSSTSCRLAVGGGIGGAPCVVDLELVIPSPVHTKHPLRNHGLVGNLHTIGTISGCLIIGDGITYMSMRGTGHYFCQVLSG